jgi:DNA polymerase III epsilon subunit-like protein
MSGISFTAIDFETANSHRGSACAVALVKVRDRHIADTASWLIKPPPGIDEFDPINVELHGITGQDVQNAADWEMSLEGILQFVGEDPLVAFDAAYDASVMRKATEQQHLDLPAKDFYCALHLAQHHLDLPQHRLSDVLEALNLPPVQRHDVQAHALACAQIVIAIAEEHGFTTLSEVWEEPTTAVGKRRRGRRVRTDADPEAGPDASLAVAMPDAGPHRAADHTGNAEAGCAEAGTVDLLQLSRAEPNDAATPGTTKPHGQTSSTGANSTAKGAFSMAAGLALFALGLAAAVGLAFLTGLTIRFFAAGQAVTAAVTLASAAATMWAIWASITRGWRRLLPSG